MADEEVKIDIKSHYDPTGTNKAKQDLRQLANTVEGAANAGGRPGDSIRDIKRATDEDFMLIPDITANWDKMKPSPSTKKGDRVKYINTYGKTTYILAERVGSRKKDNPRLMFTTIFFKKKTN